LPPPSRKICTRGGVESARTSSAEEAAGYERTEDEFGAAEWMNWRHAVTDV